MTTRIASALGKSNRHRPCHIFLTGQPAVGKTTLIKAIIESCSRSNSIGDDESVPLRVRHNDEDIFVCKQSNINLCGFYTEESRGADGKRNGFDLISFGDQHKKGDGNYDDDGSCDNAHIKVSRSSLSRAQSKVTKGKPFVGKYLVDIDNVDQYGVASLEQVTNKLGQKTDNSVAEQQEVEHRTICILDEVGKMELLCPTFLPAVNNVLDAISEHNNNRNKQKNDSAAGETIASNSSCLLLGTIPTPRYGRIIQAVEDIRSRGDVMVLHVTKQNRDELRSKLISYVESWSLGGIEDEDGTHSLEEYIYQRPIGSGSMTSKGKNEMSKNNSKKARPSSDETNHESKTTLIACDPLLHNKVEPKVLLLGHTASPKPDNLKLAYCERSMWTILSRIHEMPHEPIQDAAIATEAQSEKYQSLVDAVLQSGVCIWDVLSNVHVKSQQKPKGQRGGKRKMTSSDDNTASPNDIPTFLEKHKSIHTIAFIGTKANSEFNTQFGKDIFKEQVCKAVSLPSSSRANSRMTMEEKVKQWRDAIGN